MQSYAACYTDLRRVVILSLAFSVAARGQRTDDPEVVNFGQGISQGRIHTHEETVYEYNTTTDGRGVLTHFWITGGDYVCGGHDGACPPPLNSSNNWNPYIDHVIIRFYVESLHRPRRGGFYRNAASHGLWSSRTVASFDPPKGGVLTPTGYVGRGQTRAPWSGKFFGKGSANGGWWFNGRIPFGEHIRVTTELPPVPQYPQVTAVGMYMQVRGAENVPIVLGGVRIPLHARLKLQKIWGREYRWLDYVNLLDLPQGRGAVLMNTYAVQIAAEGFMEGCVHIYTPYQAKFPGLLLATGLEDYYNSAYYFSAGQFTFPETGQTWFTTPPWNASHPGQWSAYRVHDSDLQFFRDGVRLVTRIGDTSNKAGYKCICDPQECPPTAGPNATVWSYTWYYEW